MSARLLNSVPVNSPGSHRRRQSSACKSALHFSDQNLKVQIETLPEEI